MEEKASNPNCINWSYLYRGKVALTHKKVNNSKET